jgi:hypothetical protein
MINPFYAVGFPESIVHPAGRRDKASTAAAGRPSGGESRQRKLQDRLICLVQDQFPGMK